MTEKPNYAPQLTPVGAFDSTFAVDITVPPGLSFGA